MASVLFTKLKDLQEKGFEGFDKRQYRLQWHFAADMKFTWTILGMVGVHDPCMCPFCLFNVNCAGFYEQDKWEFQRDIEEQKLLVNQLGKHLLSTIRCTCKVKGKNHHSSHAGVCGDVLLPLSTLKRLGFDILHAKNRVTEKFVKLWIWSYLHTKKSKDLPKTTKENNLNSFLQKMKLKKFKGTLRCASLYLFLCVYKSHV
jgi:hypothetical protein